MFQEQDNNNATTIVMIKKLAESCPKEDTITVPYHVPRNSKPSVEKLIVVDEFMFFHPEEPDRLFPTFDL